MTIEVRQMLIRSVVTDEAAPDAALKAEPAWTAQQIERLRQQLLAECKAWLDERLRQAGER